jgi:hypothetical protein
MIDMALFLAGQILGEDAISYLALIPLQADSE